MMILKHRHLPASLVGALAFLLVASAAPAAAQAPTCEEVDEQTKAMNYSLYYESFKNKDYEAAAPYLRWILKCAPAYAGPNRLSDKNVERAIDVYEGLAMNAEGDLQKAYLDTALMWFDQAVPTLREAGVEDVDEFIWKRDKGRFIQEHQEVLPDMQNDAFALYREAYEIDPTRLQPYYLRLVIYNIAQSGDKQATIAFMDEVEANMTEPDPELEDYIAQVRGQLFRTPEERMGYLEGELAKKPDDMEIMAELFEIYRDLQFRQKMFELGDRLSEMDPNARVYRLLAEAKLADGEAEEALELFQKALDMEGAEEQARDIYYNMGIAYQQVGRLANARTYFRRALQEDSGFGQALIGIGDLYVTAVAECGGGAMSRDDKAVYWLAADYYDRARSADSDVASAANTKLRSIRPYFPTEEDKFFKKWNSGDSYSVSGGCYSWIGETTRVR